MVDVKCVSEVNLMDIKSAIDTVQAVAKLTKSNDDKEQKIDNLTEKVRHLETLVVAKDKTRVLSAR